MYKIMMKSRSTGEWIERWTKNELSTIEEANAVFDALMYSSDFVNYQIVDGNNNVVRDWLKERSA